MSLTPILALAPFEKWGIDFVGPINPSSSHRRYQDFLVATNYVTKWAKTEATKKNDKHVVAKFIREYSITLWIYKKIGG